MEISNHLKKMIEEKDVIGIRSAFFTMAHEDPGFSSGKYEKTLEYVKSLAIPGLFQVYDGEAFKGEAEWNEGYWAEVASKLQDNFCEERIQHLKAVGRKLYPTVAKQTPQSGGVQSKKEMVEVVGERKASSLAPVFVGIGVIVLIVVLLIVLL